MTKFECTPFISESAALTYCGDLEKSCVQDMRCVLSLRDSILTSDFYGQNNENRSNILKIKVPNWHSELLNKRLSLRQNSLTRHRTTTPATYNGLSIVHPIFYLIFYLIPYRFITFEKQLLKCIYPNLILFPAF